MKILKLFHLFNPLIIGIFFILFLYSNNLGEGIKPFEVISLFFIVGIFSYSIYLISFFIYKNSSKASFYSLILLFIFLSYGYFYDLLNEIIFINELSRHRYLVPLILIYLLIQLILLKKKEWELKNFHKIFFMTFLTLIVINLFSIISFDLRPSNPLFETKNINVKNEYNDLPDVYHIVLDMYPTEDILKTRFEFDNSQFVNELESLGFRKEDMRSNYMWTRFSIPSTINMKHFHDATQEEINYMHETHYSFNKSVEAYLAKKIGYEIYEISTDDIKGFYGYFLGDFSRIFFRTNFIRVIDDSPIRLHKVWTNINQKYFKDNIDELVKISSNNETTWVYFYSRPPHPPFIFNEDGSKNLDFDQDEYFSWDVNNKIHFINQLKYLNKHVLQSVNNILSSSKNSIIIIHSDDGIPGLTGSHLISNDNEISSDIFNELFSTINFIYTPNKCISNDYKIGTNINIISTLFRKCFKLDIEDSENIQFWSPESNSKELIYVK